MATKVEIEVNVASKLLEDVFEKAGWSHENAVKISDHLIDAELRGYGIAGLSRALSILDYLHNGAIQIRNSMIERHSGPSASVDGRNDVGYVVGYDSMQTGIAIAKENGVAVVAVKNTMFTGMLSYWAEMATANDLCAIISSHTEAFASPSGTSKALLGTNPFCMAVPSSGAPIVFDLGTSASTFGEIKMAQRLGQKLRPGCAYDKEGNPTTDPDEAMKGTFAVREGAVGTGLSIMVQVMGAVCGAPVLPQPKDGYGMMITLFSPKLFGSLETYKQQIDGFIKIYEAAPVKDGFSPPRIPYARSYRTREINREKGKFEVFEDIVKALEAAR